MTTYMLGGTSLTQLTEALADDDRFLVNNKSDTTTAPADADGSSQWIAAKDAAIAFYRGARLVLPSGDTSGSSDATAIAAAVTALGSGQGVIKLAPVGQWYISGGSVAVTHAGQFIDGPGCFVNAKGAGAVFDFSTTDTTRAVNGGGLTGFPQIDGGSTTGNACAVHAGDILQLTVDVQATNFTAGTTSKGVWFDNRHSWTEQLHARIYAANCTAGVVLDHASGSGASSTGSYDRAILDIQLDQSNTPTADGVVLSNGANIQHGRLEIRGNFGGSASALTSAVLKITGTSPASTGDTGTPSSILNSEIYVGAECDSTAAHGTLCLSLGSSSNFIGSCDGALNYLGATTAFGDAVLNGGGFDFAGNINGAGGLSSTYTMTTLNTTFINGFGLGDPAQMAPDAFGNWQNTAGDGNVYDIGQRLVQTTAQTAGTTGTSAQNVTGLVTPTLEAGAKYYLDILLSWEPTVTGGVTNFGLAAGSSLTLSAISMGSLIGGMGTAAAGGTAGYVTSTTLSSAMWSSPTRTGTTGFGYCHLWGTVTVNHAGTLQVVFANGTSADTATIAAGATMLIRPAN